jgi:hypothetical protein
VQLLLELQLARLPSHASFLPSLLPHPAGKNLQAQYERWQPRAKYKMHLDPTLEDVKKLAASCRRTAKAERVLFHYNGHGVPRPTVNGEIWVFNSRWLGDRGGWQMHSIPGRGGGRGEGGLRNLAEALLSRGNASG